MHTHFGHFEVTVTNFDGVDSEADHVMEIIENSLRSAGYKACVTLSHYAPYEVKEKSE